MKMPVPGRPKMRPEVIDCHTHFFPDRLHEAIWDWFGQHGWPIRYKVGADEAVKLLGDNGMTRFVALNYAHKPGMSESLNAWTYEFSQRYPQAIPFGTFHPGDRGLERLLDRCFVDYRFFGLKFHCHVAGIRPDDKGMFPVYEKLIEHDRVMTLHAGVGPRLEGYKESTREVSGARFVRNLLKRFPRLRIIVPHLGADEFDEFFRLMEEFPNLWMDTTMIPAGFFPIEVPWEGMEKFSDRIVYGSDFPNISFEMMSEVDAILSSPLTPKAQQKILSGNARRLFGLSG